MKQDHTLSVKSLKNSSFIDLSQVNDGSDSSTTELVTPTQHSPVDSDSCESSATELVTPVSQSLSPELSDKHISSATQIDTFSSPLRQLNAIEIKPNQQATYKSPNLKESQSSSIFESISSNESEMSDAIVTPEAAQKIKKLKKKVKTNIKTTTPKLIYRTPNSKSSSLLIQKKEEKKKKLHTLFPSSPTSTSTSSSSSSSPVTIEITPLNGIISPPPNPIRYPFIPSEVDTSPRLIKQQKQENKNEEKEEETEIEENRYQITVILQPLTSSNINENDSNNSHSYSIETNVDKPSKFIYPPTLENLITNLFYTEYYKDYHEKEIHKEIQKLSINTYDIINFTYNNTILQSPNKPNNKMIFSTPSPHYSNKNNNNKRKYKEYGYDSDDENSDISSIKRFKSNNYQSKSLPSPSPPIKIIQKLNNFRSTTCSSIIEHHKDSINILQCEDESGLYLLDNKNVSFYQTNNQINNNILSINSSPRKKRNESKLFDGIYFMFTGFKRKYNYYLYV